MRKLKQKALFAGLCFGLFLSGCQKTPEQVEENMSWYGDNPQINESEVTYCTVVELREMKMPDCGEAALKFPASVDFSRVEEVGVLRLSWVKNFLSEDNVKKYADLFGVDRDKFQVGGMMREGDTLEYDNGKDKYMNISEDGGMAQGFGVSYDPQKNKVERKYKLDEEDISGVTVRLADGEVNLAKLCQDTENWLETNMPVSGLHYKVSDAWVRKENRRANDDPVRVVSMCAEYDYMGMRLNNHTMSLDEEDENFHTKTLTASMSVLLDYETQGIPCFFSQNGFFAVASSEPVEKVVDLASAVRVVKEKLSGFGAIQITKILPIYALYYEDNAKTSQADIEARPVYAFMIEEESEDQLIGVIKTNNCKKFLYVDMITGELTASFEI